MKTDGRTDRQTDSARNVDCDCIYSLSCRWLPSRWVWL